MDVVVDIVAVGMVVLEDPVVADPATITLEAGTVAVVIVKEMGKETIKIVNVIRATGVAIAMEWIAILTKVVNVPTKATMVAVATKETMATIATTTREVTGHLMIEGVHRMLREVIIVEVHLEEHQEDRLEGVGVVAMIVSNRMLKSKEENLVVKPESSLLNLF